MSLGPDQTHVRRRPFQINLRQCHEHDDTHDTEELDGCTASDQTAGFFRCIAAGVQVSICQSHRVISEEAVMKHRVSIMVISFRLIVIWLVLLENFLRTLPRLAAAVSASAVGLSGL